MSTKLSKQIKTIFRFQTKSEETSTDKYLTNLLLIVIILLSFGLRLHQLDGQSLWRDELFSIFVTSSPFDIMIGSLIFDRVHPPLYYFLLFPWIKIGQTEFFLRVFSLFWGVLTVPLLYRFGKLIGGPLIGIIGAFLLAISPFHIWFSQEGRMHTFLIFLIVASGWFLLRLSHHDSRKNWLGYFVSMLLAIYTHYFAFLILFSHFVTIILNRTKFEHIWHKFIRQVIFIGIFFSAWAGILLLTGGLEEGNIEWINSANWYEPFLTLFIFSSGFGTDLSSFQSYVNLLIFSIGLIGAVKISFSQNKSSQTTLNAQQFGERRFDIQLLWLWFLIPLAITWVLSLDFFPFFNRSIYMDRNLIVIFPALLILVTGGLAYFTRNRPPILIITLIIISLMNGLTLEHVYNNPTHSREEWRAAYHQIQANHQESDSLLIPTGSLLPWWYYADEIPYNLLPESFEEDVFSQQIAELDQESTRVWLISFLSNRNPHGFPAKRNKLVTQISEDDPFAAWLATHYTLEDEWIFTGMRVGLYNLQEP